MDILPYSNSLLPQNVQAYLAFQLQNGAVQIVLGLLLAEMLPVCAQVEINLTEQPCR